VVFLYVFQQKPYQLGAKISYNSAKPSYYLSSSHPGMFAVASLTIFTRVTWKRKFRSTYGYRVACWGRGTLISNILIKRYKGYRA